MNEETKQRLKAMLYEMDIDRSPVKNVREWFPAYEEGVVTFRVATEWEFYYLSFPLTFSFDAQNALAPSTAMLDIRLRAVLTVLQQTDFIHEPDRDMRAYGTMGCIQTLLDGLARSPQLTHEQQERVRAISDAWKQAIWGRKNKESEGITQ
jgi:hypothetical protein